MMTVPATVAQAPPGRVRSVADLLPAVSDHPQAGYSKLLPCLPRRLRASSARQFGPPGRCTGDSGAPRAPPAAAPPGPTLKLLSSTPSEPVHCLHFSSFFLQIVTAATGCSAWHWLTILLHCCPQPGEPGRSAEPEHADGGHCGGRACAVPWPHGP